MAIEASFYNIDGTSYIEVQSLIVWLMACREELPDEHRSGVSNMIIALSKAVSSELDKMESDMVV